MTARPGMQTSATRRSLSVTLGLALTVSRSEEGQHFQMLALTGRVRTHGSFVLSRVSRKEYQQTARWESSVLGWPSTTEEGAMEARDLDVTWLCNWV